MSYFLALAGNKRRGARTDVRSLVGVDSAADPKTALDRAVQVFLGGQAGPTTVETLEKQLDNPQVLQAKLDDPRKQGDLGVVAGFVLGAPEFQRRWFGVRELSPAFPPAHVFVSSPPRRCASESHQ